MTQTNNAKGHISALITISIWGTTFISTKVLLADFKPIEILFFRSMIGLLALIVAYPHRLKDTTKKQELLFMLAGLCGITLYYLLENIALTYTLASNVSIILSVAPFFTAIFSMLFSGGEKPGRNFFIGFATSIIGIFLISFNGSNVLKLNPMGDFLALTAAIIWAIYSILVKKISEFGYNTIQTTRRIFFYGLIFMALILLPMDFKWELKRFLVSVNLLNILFLGLGASAMCFVTWSLAVKLLGAVKTSTYIYLNPVITVIASAIILKEKITLISALGTILILTGLFISERKNS